MTIDMGEVQTLFFEESFENIDVMESGLLDLHVGAVDKEQINSIFRAAHSIKGGAGIFQFDKVVHFAHTIETLLDEMRNDKHTVTQSLIDTLLRSVDVLRMLLNCAKDNTDSEDKEVLTCQRELEACLNEPLVPFNDGSAPEVQVTPEVETPSTTQSSDQDNATNESDDEQDVGWHISFKPHETLLQTGNDPIHIFRELESLGELEVSVDTSKIPDFAALDPQSCYLSWELVLHSEASREDIEEVFDWVLDDCDLHITALGQSEEVVKISAEKPPEEEPIVEPTVSVVSEEVPTTEDRQDIPETVQPETIQTETTVNPTENTAPPQPVPQKASLSKETKESGNQQSHHSTTEANSIRVGIDKIDALINIVGELVITQSMLDQVGEDFDQSRLQHLRDGLSQLERNTRELQESVMRVRMLPISYSFNRFPRLVHDLSVQLGKKVKLKLSGEHTELDKTVLEKMSDPLVHLVRNALDHGIEMPDERLAAGKDETGTLHLHAFHQGGNIIIQISDDGAGIDLEKIRQKSIEKKLLSADESTTEEHLYEMIFHPGFSTAVQVSDLSGRGVGMDVVRRNIRALGGTIEVQSKLGMGTTFNIRLPLTLAILDGQLVRVGEQIYILSLLSIIESLRINPRFVNTLAGKAEVYKLRDEYIPILRLYAMFDIEPSTSKLDEGLLVIVEGDGQKIGLFVDELLSQQQIVIKSLETNYKQVSGISGATILGDGNVALILDVAGLIKNFRSQVNLPSRHKLAQLVQARKQPTAEPAVNKL